MKRIAIVLCGSGVQDGSEIHESVLTLLHVVKNGAKPIFFAPDENQTRVFNHAKGEEMSESRNMMVEAARIARGEILPITKLTANSAEAVIFPGGFGAALNLCDFAKSGEYCHAHPEVVRVIKEFHAAKKPIGAICIAPVIVARVLGNLGVELTIGTDSDTAGKINAMGATPISAQVNESVVDRKNLVVSTPAYMLAKNIAEAESGISKLVHDVMSLCG